MNWESLGTLAILLGMYYTAFFFFYIKPCYIDTGRKHPWF